MQKHWNLYIRRMEAGETQADVAKKLGISQNRYSLKETKRADFTLMECKKLSELYGVTIDELFADTTQQLAGTAK